MNFGILKRYKILVKNEVDKPIKYFEQIIMDSITHINLQIFVRPIESLDNLSKFISNGICERNSHTIIDIMICLLIINGLLKS